MNNLKIGFGRTNITPPLGTPMVGYYEYRYADNVRDELYVNALALENNGVQALLISVSVLEIKSSVCKHFINFVTRATGVKEDNVYITATHTHTGPAVDCFTEDEAIKKYTDFLGCRIADAATFAMEDLKPAKMGYGKGTAPNVSFIRRYIMKDGSVKTNPGINNPDIVRPLSEPDRDVNVVRFDRENAETITLVNFANHPDTISGSSISADWPGFVTEYVEKFFDNTKCIFINGAQGDVNHVNVHPKGGDNNGLTVATGACSSGYEHTKHIAKVVLGGVLQAYDKVCYCEDTEIFSKRKVVKIPSNKADASELPEAHLIHNLQLEGRSHELPYTDMELTTVLARAARIVRLENAPDYFEETISALSIGPVAIIGFPGEPFAEIGKQVKKANGFDMIIPNCLANGGEAYFPMKDSYECGGFEVEMCNFKAGVGELLIEESIKLLETLKNK